MIMTKCALGGGVNLALTSLRVEFALRHSDFITHLVCWTLNCVGFDNAGFECRQGRKEAPSRHGRDQILR